MWKVNVVYSYGTYNLCVHPNGFPYISSIHSHSFFTKQKALELLGILMSDADAFNDKFIRYEILPAGE